MKIRKVEEKPMVLHTRKKPTLHIQKKKKLTGNDKPKSYIQIRGKGRADKKEKAYGSVQSYAFCLSECFTAVPCAGMPGYGDSGDCPAPLYDGICQCEKGIGADGWRGGDPG